MAEEVREYVVTLKNFDDLDDFYDDMETPGGNLYIPGRSVDVANRRSISRNTHYYLTDSEADTLRNDPRVLDVSKTPEELGLIARPLFTQTETDWDKSGINNSNHNNWGLLRCVEGAQRSGWGSDSTAIQSGTITTTSEGRNVDVVIVDGLINPLHPEYALNSDGTGGSRVIQYNWYQHRLAVEGLANSTFVYANYTGTGAEGDNNHGAHVAGTVAGNTQGWARQANIYNISPYGNDGNSLSNLYLYDYIRAFHNAKALNPAIGRKNPTIMNNSWGYYSYIYYTNVTNLRFRGTVLTGPFTVNQLNSYGAIVAGDNYVYAGYRYTAIEVDIEDCINAGIISIGAAANDSVKIDTYGGIDYNNYLNSGSVYYHRGPTPGASALSDNSPATICVGSIGPETDEDKSYFSNCGPRVDIYAPGHYIQSSLHSGGVNDSRNNSYKLGKYSGTSMASPQVCGVLACLLETYPDLTQAGARNLLTKISKKDQITDLGRLTNTYSVTNSGSSDYVFSGSGSGNDITITVVSGTILVFNVSATGHPFWIKTVQGTGTGDAVTTGTITNNGTASGTITWDTYGVNAGTYYYNCQFHSSMSGQIVITSEFSAGSYYLLGSGNRYLYYSKERETSGTVFPNQRSQARPSSGAVFPRTRIRVRK